MTPNQLTSEAEQKDELLFALHHRDASTVVFMECNSYAKREELDNFLQRNLNEYQFFNIDVTPFQVVSLLRVLTERLPADIVQSQPVQYVVNVFGLENSLLVSEEGRLKSSQLTAQLNLERELLFRNVPYIIIIWADQLFFQTLQRESPDLWSWVVYRFRFEGSDAVDPENAPPIPPERLPQRGNIAERQRRITELGATYNQLNLDTSDKKRLLKDKITILKLLAEEYTEAFRYDDAQRAYESAIAIADRMREDEFLRGTLYFDLASVLLDKRDLSEALIMYERTFPFAEEYQFGSLYHQIGMVHQAQKNWESALYNYKKALEYNEKLNITHEIGSTFHQIGRVYEEQSQWMLALENYQKALDWKEKTGTVIEIGSTYHQIGVVYHCQQQWQLALDNYQKAIEWNKRVGNTYELGGTYHQIGLVYAEQQHWESSLENYKESLKWNENTGNTYELGGTYHQIGRVYEEQNDNKEALKWYSLAVNNLTIYHRNDVLPIAQKSIDRVENKIAEEASQ